MDLLNILLPKKKPAIGHRASVYSGEHGYFIARNTYPLNLDPKKDCGAWVQYLQRGSRWSLCLDAKGWYSTQEEAEKRLNNYLSVRPAECNGIRFKETEVAEVFEDRNGWFIAQGQTDGYTHTLYHFRNRGWSLTLEADGLYPTKKEAEDKALELNKPVQYR